MYFKTLSLLVILFIQSSAFSENIKVYPTPQTMKTEGKTLTLNPNIILIGESEADPEVVRQLKELINVNGDKKGYKIYIGEGNDKAVKKFTQGIPHISGAYYLSVNDERTVIAGHDERGTFYALQTLAQLKKGNTLEKVEITDYPDIAYRGVVEGFYGQPWSYEDRVSQLAFYGQNKLNVYIYGPKDDPYHSSPNWRKPYPAKEAAQITDLVKISNANKVDFTWAIHPGQDIQWNDEDKSALLNKFENMYVLGVRSFAVFFDDISGEGTDPNRQAELLNFLDEQFVAKKPDVTPLIMCPTEYNKSWANPKSGTYLDILGEKLNPGIMVMWTGDRVVADITSEGLQWVNKRIKRPAYVWWNFPVNDYVRNHLLMGPAYGLDLSAQKEMSGFVSNPMERAEASKIAIASIADYSWNLSAYDHNDSWEHAIQKIMPQATSAFRTFAAHNSDLGKNGHKYRRDESVEIKGATENFLNDYQNGKIQKETADQITKEFEKIKLAPGQLFATTNNPALITEIRPWLEQFEVLGQTGVAAVQLASLDLAGDPVQIWKQYNQLLQADVKREYIDKNNNKNPYQPGIKTGSLVMQPFIDTIAKTVETKLYSRLSGKEKQGNGEIIPALFTNIEQLKNLQLQFAGQSVSITPILEVVRIQPDEYVGIELPLLTHNVKVDMNLNSPSAQKWGSIEISKDGGVWEKVKPEAQEKNITVSIPDNGIRYVRFANHGTTPQEIYLKKFTLSSDELSTEKNNPVLARDGELKTAYTLLGGLVVTFNNPAPTKKDQEVSILLEPHSKINLTVMAIDKANKSTQIGTMTNALSTFNCPAGTKSIKLSTNGTSVNIHEVIWK